MKFAAGEGKKERNFGRPGGKALNTPTTHTHNTKTNHNTTHTKNGLAKNGLAKIGLAKVGHYRPRRVGPRRVRGPDGWGTQNFALFLPCPATVSLFLCHSGGLLVEFWCLKHRGAQMCTFGLSGCRVKPRRPQMRRGKFYVFRSRNMEEKRRNNRSNMRELQGWGLLLATRLD